MRAAWIVGLATLLLPLAAYAAGGGDGEGEGNRFWFEVGNLALLVGFLVYVSRKPVLGYLSDRRSQIQGDLESAEKQLTSSEARLQEWTERSEGVETEMAEIRRAARAGAETEAVSLQKDAEATATRIRGSAGEAVASEVRRARQRLRRETSDRAIERAAELLREQVTDDDQERLVDEFVSRLERGEAA